MGIGIGRRILAWMLGPVLLFTILQGVLLRELESLHHDPNFQVPTKQAFTNTGSSIITTTAQMIEDPSDSRRLENQANTPNNMLRGESKVSGSAAALFWLFPGSGEHYLECALDHGAASGLLLRGYLAGSNNSSNNTKKMNKDAVMLGSMIPKKRVILVRHPLDAIWERYEHAQTGSLTRNIQERDFHSKHFELQALAWAKEYRDGRFPPFCDNQGSAVQTKKLQKQF